MSGPVTVALLPCPNPWCEGAEREGDFTPSLRRGLLGNHYVACTSCCMDGPKRQTEAEAITAWNTRQSAEAAFREREAALVEALENLANAARATPRFASRMLLAEADKALARAKASSDGEGV